MLADTTGTPSFVTLAPDWSRPVTLVTAWDTAILANRESGEQRHRRRQAPRLSISYDHRSMTPGQFATQRARMVEQTGKATVVPVWTEYGVLQTNNSNSVVLTATITSLKFKVGSWIYASQAGAFCFRKVTGVSVATITLSAAAGDFYPLGFDFDSFTPGARIYPCILGVRVGMSYRTASRRLDRVDHVVSVEEL